MNRARRRRRISLACLALALLCPGSASAARPLELGFSDGAFTGPAGATWLQRSADVGAGMVRINIGWDAPDTPARPSGFDARNPADPHYDFSRADAVIRQASGLGLRVLAMFTGAPRWAEGAHRSADAPHGSWRPDPQAVGDYGVALARRYSGQFPDPANPGQMLPKVDAFQLWNEPNLSDYLNPQWSGGRTAAPAIYRAMLNAFYRGVKSVDPAALVVLAGTGPFGDPQPGGGRIMPLRFWRDLMCVNAASGGGLHGGHCNDPAHFDVAAHHIYSWGTPQTRGLWPDDVTTPDIGKIVRVLRAAERAGAVLPRGHHPVWITEVGWSTSPPNPNGVPIATQATYLEQALSEFWREGVTAVFWDQVGDQPPVPNYDSTVQSGVFFLDGRPKPASMAYRFPLVAWRAGGSAVRVWGRAPAGGRLEIERQTTSGWTTARVLDVQAGSTFSTRIAGLAHTPLRAQVAGATSLVWRTR